MQLASIIFTVFVAFTTLTWTIPIPTADADLEYFLKLSQYLDSYMGSWGTELLADISRCMDYWDNGSIDCKVERSKRCKVPPGFEACLKRGFSEYRIEGPEVTKRSPQQGDTTDSAGNAVNETLTIKDAARNFVVGFLDGIRNFFSSAINTATSIFGDSAGSN